MPQGKKTEQIYLNYNSAQILWYTWSATELAGSFSLLVFLLWILSGGQVGDAFFASCFTCTLFSCETRCLIAAFWVVRIRCREWSKRTLQVAKPNPNGRNKHESFQTPTGCLPQLLLPHSSDSARISSQSTICSHLSLARSPSVSVLTAAVVIYFEQQFC